MNTVRINYPDLLFTLGRINSDDYLSTTKFTLWS